MHCKAKEQRDSSIRVNTSSTALYVLRMDKVVDSILIRKENIRYQGKVRGGEEGISQIYFYFFSTGNKKE